MKEIVPAALDGARAELAVRSLFDLPRGAVRRLCDAGRVRVDGKRAKKGDPVRAGDVVELIGGSAWLAPAPELTIPILFESDELLVVDKPRGVPCHPLVPGEGGTLVDALVTRFPEIALASDDPREAGLVHRLDTDTSGCTAIARTRAAFHRLRAAFDHGDVHKRYLALVQGRVEDVLVIDDVIAHDPRDPRRMSAGLDGGRDARTRVEPLTIGPQASAVRIEADRGRRHQVRVHLAARGHPLVGDALYGATLEAPGVAGHALHASELSLPGAGSALVHVVAPVPAELVAAAAALGCTFALAVSATGGR
jgi:23S rRNA pseudouridine1911/1915/1917 synthase